MWLATLKLAVGHFWLKAFRKIFLIETKFSSCQFFLTKAEALVLSRLLVWLHVWLEESKRR
jgi:hypothetical protein